LENDELMEALLPTLRADFTLCETYNPEPEPPFEYPILALAGEHDPRASPADLNHWREYTRGRFEVRAFPGEHFFLQTHRPTALGSRARTIAATPRRLHPLSGSRLASVL